MALSRKTKTLPKSLYLSGIDLKEKDPRILGGNADIFYALYKGQPVALKRLRLSQQVLVTEKDREVCGSHFCCRVN